jgi:aspartyl protease family protein
MALDLDGNTPLYLLLLGILAVGFIARRIPIVGTLVSLAIWAALAYALVLAVDQRQRFDPYLGQLAGWLKLEDQRVVGKELRIRMSPDGHFWARARFGGIERRMLVDSGATVTALSAETAAAAGLTVRDELFPVLLRTANGTINAQTARIDELRLGNIVARDVPVVVSPAFGTTDVLGMNFLSRLKSWRVEGRTLVLVPHHPQDVET